LWAVLALLAGAGTAWGDVSTGAAAYLYDGVGARASGMGNAFVAVASDATAGYWNPAGLTNLGLLPYSLAMMYTFQTFDRTLNYLGYGQQTDDLGSFGINWINSGMSNIESVDSSGNVNGTLADQENAFIFSYANSLDYSLRWGGNAKLLQQSLASASAWGCAFDAALLYQPFLTEDLYFGLNVQNIGGNLRWSTGRNDPVLLNVKLGASYQLWDQAVLVAFDADKEDTVNDLKFHAGAEYKAMDGFVLRGGWDDQTWTAGASFVFSIIFELDYAYLYNQNDLGDTNQISMVVRF
jgi:hypothetical protein